jgi:hypothetical protein
MERSHRVPRDEIPCDEGEESATSRLRHSVVLIYYAGFLGLGK